MDYQNQSGLSYIIKMYVLKLFARYFIDKNASQYLIRPFTNIINS